MSIAPRGICLRRLISALSLAVLPVMSSALASQVPVSFSPTDPFDLEEIDAGSGLSPAEYACVASIPREQMALVAVYLHARLADYSPATLTFQGDLMSEDVSKEILRLLGSKPGYLPRVDPRISPLAVPAELLVIERRDGSATRKAFSRFGDTAATSLLTKAFDAARRRNEAVLVWPEGYDADSIIVRLVLLPATRLPDGRTLPPRSNRAQFGVFRMLQTFDRFAMLKPGQPMPRYPAELNAHRVDGKVLLRFTVDRTGTVIPGSIRDVRPEQNPELAEFLTPAHATFAKTLADVVREWKFEPARIGPCPVKRFLQLPIAFHAPQGP